MEKNSKNVVITREKIGFKFGEFSFTRKYSAKQKSIKIKKNNLKYGSKI